MNLIIDEGNTRVKLAVYQEKKMLFLTQISNEIIEKTLKALLAKYRITAVIVSSVTDKIVHFIEPLPMKHKVILTPNTPVPFQNLYKTPTTLGVDRLALVTGAWTKYPQQPTLIIDAGTCITYDFITKEGTYLGGAIAPGVEMRYKAMHQFTQKLPLITSKQATVAVAGNTTQGCMESGVVNGIVFEMEGMIQYYQQNYKAVNVILTGGNAKFLYKRLKNSIFVNPNFLLDGLNEILTYQFSNEATKK